MIKFKSTTYDSNQIREGLMSIKKSQMELLRELKSENHILKKYTPQNSIFEQRSEYNKSTLPIHQQYNHRVEPFQQLSATKPKPSSYLSVNSNSYLSQKSTTNLKQQQQSNSYYIPPNTSEIKFIYGVDSRELDLMTEEFHRMKKLYFGEKQKIKDMVLHMEFAASLHNTVLKDVLQGMNLDSIKIKVRQQVESYQREFPEFKAFGLQQAFNIISLQSDIVLPSLASQLRTPKRTQIFPPKHIHHQQSQGELLKQLSDLKCELRELSLQKDRKTQQVRLIRSQNEYNIQMLKRQVQMKQEKIGELVGELIGLRDQLVIYKDGNRKLQKQLSQMQSNVVRLKSQLQRNLNKIQILQSKNSSSYIDKEQQLVKKVQSLEITLRDVDKEQGEKLRLIKSLQESVSKLQAVIGQTKGQNQQLKLQIHLLKQQIQVKNKSHTQLQNNLKQQQLSHAQQLSQITTRNQQQQLSLKQHIHHLKLNLQQMLQHQQSSKLSQIHLTQLRQKRVQAIRLSKTIDHLWKIKQVQYDNLAQLLTQLNLIKTPPINNHLGNNNTITKPHKSKSKSSSSKQKPSQQNNKNTY